MKKFLLTLAVAALASMAMMAQTTATNTAQEEPDRIQMRHLSKNPTGLDTPTGYDKPQVKKETREEIETNLSGKASEQKIMSAFGDRIEHRYNDGSTILTLVVTRSAHIAARDIGITMALAILALAIYSDAVFGSLLSATNAAGDIVTVAIAEKQEKASRK